MPYFFIIFTMIPVFVIAFLLPGKATTTTQISLDVFLDGYFLGRVGYWSSKFPFVSKVIANYIGVFGPLFSLVTYFKIRKTMIIDPAQYDNMTSIRCLFMMIGMIGLIFLVLYMFYLGDRDLGVHTLKWRLFGSHVIPFALFSASMLVIFHSLPVFIYSTFYFVPRLLLNRRKEK